MAVYELGMDEEEFLRKSPRQLLTLITLNRRHRLGILREVASEILGAGSDEEQEIIQEVDSFSEIF